MFDFELNPGRSENMNELDRFIAFAGKIMDDNFIGGFLRYSYENKKDPTIEEEKLAYNARMAAGIFSALMNYKKIIDEYIELQNKFNKVEREYNQYKPKSESLEKELNACQARCAILETKLEQLKPVKKKKSKK